MASNDIIKTMATNRANKLSSASSGINKSIDQNTRPDPGTSPGLVETTEHEDGATDGEFRSSSSEECDDSADEDFFADDNVEPQSEPLEFEEEQQQTRGRRRRGGEQRRRRSPLSEYEEITRGRRCRRSPLVEYAPEFEEELGAQSLSSADEDEAETRRRCEHDEGLVRFDWPSANFTTSGTAIAHDDARSPIPSRNSPRSVGGERASSPISISSDSDTTEEQATRSCKRNRSDSGDDFDSEHELPCDPDEMDEGTFELWNAAPSEHESDGPEVRCAIEQMRERSVRRRLRQRRD